METVRTVHDDDGRGIAWLLERGPLTCAAAVLVLSVVKYGIGLYPSWRYMQEFAQHWQHPLRAPVFSHVHARFLLDSPVSAEIAGIVRLTSAREYLAFHLVLACAAIVVPFCLRAVRQSAELRLAVSLLLVGGTVPALLLSWVGSYDPVSVGPAAVAGLASNPVVRALAALGVGWLFLADRRARNLPAARALLLLALLTAVGMPLLALDRSRTIATTLWPAMLLTAGIVVDRLGAERARAVLARIAPVALILVIVVAWNTHLVYPGWRSGADVLLYLVGHHALPVP